MRPVFEELDFRQTPLGELILRRRRLAMLDDLEIHEVILGDGYLMSSLFHEAEVALADLGLKAAEDVALEVVVGGLGLGYTAVAALREPRVAELLVIDALAPVIEWHQRGLVPLGPILTADPRCRLIEGDFFQMAGVPDRGFDPERPGRRFHAVLLDIDHSPVNLLHERHGGFYGTEGLRRLSEHLLPGGVFAMWSDDAPDGGFTARLGEIFEASEAQVVKFWNPLLEKSSESTVYVARKAWG
jgi:spermidine synthase